MCIIFSLWNYNIGFRFAKCASIYCVLSWNNGVARSILISIFFFCVFQKGEDAKWFPVNSYFENQNSFVIFLFSLMLHQNGSFVDYSLKKNWYKQIIIIITSPFVINIINIHQFQQNESTYSTHTHNKTIFLAAHIMVILWFLLLNSVKWDIRQGTNRFGGGRRLYENNSTKMARD